MTIEEKRLSVAISFLCLLFLLAGFKIGLVIKTSDTTPYQLERLEQHWSDTKFSCEQMASSCFNHLQENKGK